MLRDIALKNFVAHLLSSSPPHPDGPLASSSINGTYSERLLVGLPSYPHSRAPHLGPRRVPLAGLRRSPRAPIAWADPSLLRPQPHIPVGHRPHSRGCGSGRAAVTAAGRHTGAGGVAPAPRGERVANAFLVSPCCVGLNRSLHGVRGYFESREINLVYIFRNFENCVKRGFHAYIAILGVFTKVKRWVYGGKDIRLFGFDGVGVG